MDACCFNRPFDDLRQERVLLESEAVLAILQRCRAGKWKLAASEMLEFELTRIPNREKRGRVLALYTIAEGSPLLLTPEIEAKALEYADTGMMWPDSCHLALAEASHQDVFLTTDDAFLSASKRAKLRVRVANPVDWIMEILHYGD